MSLKSLNYSIYIMDNRNKLKCSNKSFKYIINGEQSKENRLYVKTIGTETVVKNFDRYPLMSGHPIEFLFNPYKGRVLNVYVLLYIVKGRGKYFFSRDEFMDISEGDMILIKPNTWHSYKPDKKTGWKEYWIGFQYNNMNDIDNILNTKEKIFRIGIQDKIINLFEDAIRVANEEKPGFQLYIAGITNLILCMITYYEKNKCTDPVMEDLINKAKSIIKDNISNGITPEKVAHEIKLSYSWFRKIFKDYSGVTPSKYIQELKIREAKVLLTTSHKQIKEIAYQLGFEDWAYFIKVFKKYSDISPSQYRKLFYEYKKE